METSEFRLNRLFDVVSGRALFIAFDRGLGADVSGGGEDSAAIVDAVVSSGAEGIVLSPGMLDRQRAKLSHRGAPAVLLRSDLFVMGGLQPAGLAADGCEEYRTLVTAHEAAAMGADAMVLFFIMGFANDATTADNAQAVARTCREAHSIGLPVIVETVLWGSRSQNQSDAHALTYGCRLAAELGADAIKTQYVGDPEAMRKLINACPVPVLLLGGPKVDDDEELLIQSAAALSSGARGLVYGRNVWQADDPLAMATRLHKIVHTS